MNFKVGQRVWLKGYYNIPKGFYTITNILENGCDVVDAYGDDVRVFYSDIHQTAHDMFKELGYEMKLNNKYLIYEKESSILTFSLEHKEYWHGDNTSITIQEHQAIHQKLIELGWIE